MDNARLAALPFLTGGGKMGALMRRHEWAGTPLGLPETWPPALRLILATCLNSPLLGTVLWGPDFLMLFNDSYASSIGERYPSALGRPAREVWDETWNQVKPLFEKTMATGEGFERRNVALEISRDGRRQITWWDFSATPIRDETGTIVGLLNQGVEITAQIEALQAAKQAQERYLLMLTAGGVGTWDWDIVNDRVVADERFAHMYGVEPARAEQGAPLGEFLQGVNSNDLPHLSAAIQHSLQTGAEFVDEYRVSGKGGERWVVARGQPHLDAAGRAIRMPGVAFDITDRRGAEAALQSSEALARQILDSAVDYAIIATDLTGRITRWNTGAERTLGWSETEMLGHTAERFFTPEDLAADRIEIEMEQALAKGSGNDERWHVRKGGVRFWAQGRMAPLRDDDGQLVGYVKVLRDRTVERQQAQRLQLLARTSAGLLVAERPDDVLNAVLDASVELADFDQSFSYILTPDGQHIRLTHSSGTGPDAFEALQNAPFDGPLCGIVAQTRQPLILNHLQTSDEPRYEPGRNAGLQAYAGYPICVHDKLFGVLAFGSFTQPAFNAETLSFFATLAHYVSVVRERVDREAALLDLNSTLERRIGERTGELMAAEEHLRQSQKMEAVGQLTGGLAHDFNNLLTGITGSLELMSSRLAQGRTSDMDRYIGAAQGAARRAAALTHRLLAFSRRQTLDPKATNVNRLVAGMEELLQRTVGPAITLEPIASADLWTTLVDASQLENALLNLCINARDAMPDGGRLTIQTGNKWLDVRAAREQDVPPGQYVTLCVSDNGVGMPADVAERAFDPFFTTKPIGQGTGLGLSMIYGFARQSGGQVRIDSEPGQGTMVSLYLPRHQGAADEMEALAERSAVPRAAQDETVLIVDDEPTVRMLVIEVLEELGYTAIEAADGAAGLKVLQSDTRIDLLVTDVGLPGGMNGRQVADAGRVARPGLKVLFITGYAENAVLSHGHLDEGMYVLTKPFPMEVLGRRIRELITQK